MSLGEAESTMRADLTVIFDSKYCVKKTILFNQTSEHFTLVVVLGWCVLKRITRFFLNNFLLFLIGINFIFNLDVDLIAISFKRRRNLVVLVLVECVNVSELTEYH